MRLSQAMGVGDLVADLFAQHAPEPIERLRQCSAVKTTAEHPAHGLAVAADHGRLDRCARQIGSAHRLDPGGVISDRVCARVIGRVDAPILLELPDQEAGQARQQEDGDGDEGVGDQLRQEGLGECNQQPGECRQEGQHQLVRDGNQGEMLDRIDLRLHQHGHVKLDDGLGEIPDRRKQCLHDKCEP